MAAYRQLRDLARSTTADYESEYQARLNSPGSFVSSLYPRLMQHRKFKSADYPLFCVPLRSIQAMSIEALENSRTIEALRGKLPAVAIHQYLDDQFNRSIVATNTIEGIHTSRKDINAAYEAVKSNRLKGVRYSYLVKTYYDILHFDKIDLTSLEDIRQLYDSLLADEVAEADRLDGQLFRNSPVSIDDGAGRVIFEPARTEAEVADSLSQWLEFISDHDFPFLLRAALGHFFFENTHPFFDGNGRTGRYILTRYLSKKLDILSGLVVSQKILDNRDHYYRIFELTDDYRNRADGTLFVEGLLTFLTDGQREIIAALEEGITDLAQMGHRLGRLELTADMRYLLHVLYQSRHFTQYPDERITDSELFATYQQHGSSRRALQRAMAELEKLGYVELTDLRPKRHQLSAKFLGLTGLAEEQEE